MDYRFIHFAILSCIFLIVGFILLRSYKKSKEPHQEIMTVGTVCGYSTTDHGYRKLFADVQINGQIYRNYPFLLKNMPNGVDKGTELQIGYYLDEKGRPQCSIRSDGYEPMPPTPPIAPIAAIAIGAVFLVLALVFLIKNFIKS